MPQLVELADKGIARFVVPSAFIYKEADGTTMTLELNDLERRMLCKAA